MGSLLNMEKPAPRKRINNRVPLFDAKAFLAVVGAGKKVLKIRKNQILFSQGDPSDAVFYILEGKVKLIMVSPRGKEVDQLFNSSEKRLARLLLLLAHFGKESKTELIIPKISQETLADMIGATRSRVSFFITKFKKLGFIDHNGGLRIHSSLLNIVLHD